MFHPLKPWQRPFSSILETHNIAGYAPDTYGPNTYPTNPLAYAGEQVDTMWPAASFVTDQRVSGGNAMLWRDPSWIL